MEATFPLNPCCATDALGHLPFLVEDLIWDSRVGEEERYAQMASERQAPRFIMVSVELHSGMPKKCLLYKNHGMLVSLEDLSEKI